MKAAKLPRLTRLRLLADRFEKYLEVKPDGRLSLFSADYKEARERQREGFRVDERTGELKFRGKIVDRLDESQ